MSFITKASFAAHLIALCLKGSACGPTRNWVAIHRHSTSVRLLRLIVAVLTECTTPGDDIGHSWWLYSTMYHSLSKHTDSAAPEPKHKQGCCFVATAQSSVVWSAAVMLPWHQDNSFSLRHCRVSQSSSMGQSYTIRMHSWQCLPHPQTPRTDSKKDGFVIKTVSQSSFLPLPLHLPFAPFPLPRLNTFP